MNGLDVVSEAQQLRLQYGVSAKREGARNLFLAVAENNTVRIAFWQSVIDKITEDERRNHRIYDNFLDRELGPGDVLANELRQAAMQEIPLSASDWRVLSSCCGRAATYIGALESALRSLLNDGDAARPVATRVLIEGPPEE